VGLSKGPKGKSWHFRGDLQAVSRFGEKEISGHWERIAEFVLNDDPGGGVERERERLGLLGLGDAGEEIVNAIRQDRPDVPLDPELQDLGLAKPVITLEEIKNIYTKSTNPKAMPIPDPAKLEDKSREFMMVKMDELDNERFDRLWSRGEPIVVDGVREKMKMSWGPDDFIKRFGHELCCKSLVIARSRTKRKS